MAKEVHPVELETLVRETIEKIKRGTEGTGYTQMGDIEFELAIVKVSDKGGGLNIHVLDASGKYSKEELSKIKFKVGQRSPFFSPAVQ